MGKKCYALKAHYIESHIEKDRLLEDHKDIPEAIYNQLYRKEQERQKRQRKDKRKEDQSLRLMYLILSAIFTISCSLNLLTKI